MKTRKKTAALLSIFSALILVVTLSSCKKACNFPDNIDSGEIISDVIIYPISSGLTNSMSGDYVVNGNSPYADNFQVRLSLTSEKSDVNYALYNILGFPMDVKCDASFERSVEVIDSLSLVRYSITVYECTSQKCDETRTVENYVLVPTFPASYDVEFILKREKI